MNVSTGYSHTKQLPFHKFLRGLILREPEDTISSGYMFKEFMGLVHLRCLRSDCSFKLHSLPWFMLWNLQKLEVEVESIDEPLNIWGLPQLKNLTFHGGITLVPPRSVHHNLETIKILNYWSCTKELFVKVPNLKTLGVGEGHTINPTSNWFESLAYLYKLEELKVRGKLLHPMFRTIHLMGTLGVENFLPNLKTLKLFNTKLHWKDMFVVGMLSKLEVLSILENAVVGRKWEPKDGGFHQLKFLGISSCDLQCWKVTSGHFPVLECLVIGDMRLLKRIPSGFADIVTLKSIKLYSCLDSTISSAKRIQEEQREYGNNMFAVDILR
nr:putative disease resistance RPP13-like protein 3 [Ipomoea batatas]